MSNIAENLDRLSSSQQVLIVLQEARSRLEALERARTEPIAIIGLGCRFPGGANDPEAFWQLLEQGKDAISEIPQGRWDLDAYYDSNADAPGKMYVRQGGFLEHIDQFDPQFFGLSPRETVSLDPQQRLLLEVSWEALENAAIAPESLRDSNTGVFVGIGQNDYAQLQLTAGEVKEISPYDGSGNGFCFAAGRLSYFLGLQGPNLAVDTACSSSLVAVHLACQSLRGGECNLALAGGVQLILSPFTTISLCKTHALAPDGRCKTFDDAADGFGRGEGCGVVVLKRLRDAIADGDNILALIRASAVNHDGPSSGLTVPNGTAQQGLIRQALANARVAPEEVDYVEAHGTGTALGDPMEVRALAAALGRGRGRDNPLMVGSVKTNIGHLEAAAGVAGLLKVVLSLQHKQIPAHLHFKNPNHHIDWEQIPVSVPIERMPWPSAGKPRVAGVSSFGMSGTNAHVVLEEAPASEPVPASVERPLHLLALSARSEEALKQLARRYEGHLSARPELSLSDVCFTANAGRKHFKRRISAIAGSSAELREKLASFTAGKEAPGIFKGEVKDAREPKIAFLFAGQGSQYVGMGRQLYETQPTFRAALDKCAEILQPYLEETGHASSLLEVLYPQETGETLLNETAYTQPALFALEYALAQLWQSWGIEPRAVMGHSVGEYAAATIAGVFSLEDGLKLIAHRGKLMQALPRIGTMVAVLAEEATVREAIAPHPEKVAIAAINGPKNIVISGEAEAIQQVVAGLTSQGVKAKKLQVSHAFHSPLMEPMLADFEAVAKQITYHQPRIPLVSNVTGTRAEESIATASYWVNHVRQPVKFAASMETLQREGYGVFLEIGPKPTLLGMGRQCLPADGGVWLPSLRPTTRQAPESIGSNNPKFDDWQQMLHSLAELYLRGVRVDWAGFDRDYPRTKVVLPTYPFQRQRYWIETSENGNQKAAHSPWESKTTTIIDWLKDGNAEQLVQKLAKVGKLSPEQANLLPEFLEILFKQHQAELTAATVRDWLYQVQWQPLLETQPKTSIQPGHWLIFADTGGVGENLAQQLQQRGCECSLVYRGDRYQKLEKGTYQLNPTEPQEFEQLMRAIRENSKLPLQRVIHLWSLDVPPPKALTLTSLGEAQRWGCGAALHLVKALRETNGVPQLWLVTRGAQPVQPATEELSVAASPLWGMGRVISLEHPQLWGGMVDLDPQTPESERETLLQLLAGDEGREDHLALRGGRTYIARLVRQRPTASPPVSLESNATYLITGGLGALGLQTANWMVEKGARHLVLIGRTPPSERQIAAISNLQQQGAEVVVAQADVSDLAGLSKVFEQADSCLAPLKGIVHAAGVGAFQPMQQMELAQLEEVMAAKVMGGWILHQLTRDRELDFFVSFSSIAGVWGSAGQGHYAASNHFLDGLTHYRRAKGLPSFSINWGPWSGGGMAGGQELEELRKRGILPLSPEQGTAALEQLWTSGNLQTTVANVNWNLFKQLYEMGGRRLLLAEIEVAPLPSELTKTKGNELLEKLQSAPAGDRYGLLRTHLQREVARVLGLSDSQLPGVEQGFFELGMDSLMAVELHGRIAQLLGVTLPSTLTFDFPNVEQLTEYIVSQVLHLDLGDDAQQGEQQKVKALEADLLNEIERASEEELESSIDQILTSINY